jgi:hypothetical protein
LRRVRSGSDSSGNGGVSAAENNKGAPPCTGRGDVGGGDGTSR